MRSASMRVDRFAPGRFVPDRRAPARRRRSAAVARRPSAGWAGTASRRRGRRYARCRGRTQRMPRSGPAGLHPAIAQPKLIAELRRRQIGGVEHVVRGGAQREGQSALAGYSVLGRTIRGEGMQPAGFAVAPDQLRLPRNPDRGFPAEPGDRIDQPCRASGSKPRLRTSMPTATDAAGTRRRR